MILNDARSYRRYLFPEYAFDLVKTLTNDGVHLELVFEDTRDSMNNRHSYEAMLSNKSFESQGRTLRNVLDLLDQTYDDENECAFDYTELSNPPKFILKIYEKESSETLVFIELHPVNYI